MPGVPKSKKKSYHAIRDGCPQLSHGLCFARPDPHVREIAKYGVFRPFWPRTTLGTERNPRAMPKTEKCNFPVLGALLWGKIRTPQNFRPESAQLFCTFRFGRPDPHGEKSQNTGFLGHFCLGRPLALREIRGRIQKNTNRHIETEKREINPLQLGPNSQS